MKILSLGAVLMDQLASVERFPGADDEVFVPELRLLPGGSAANFAVFCARLGAQTGFIGKVGKDSLGEELIADLRKENVNADMIMRSDLPTGTVFVAVRSDGQRMMFAHSGAANEINELDLDIDKVNHYEHLHLADLENIDILEYAATKFNGTVSINAGALIAEKAQFAHGLIRQANVLICSQEEAIKISGEQINYMRALKEMGPNLVVVTNGQEPSIAFDGEKNYTASTYKATILDTTGAGDAFSAGFVYNYLKTNDVEASLKFANATAAIVIQSPGARGGLRDIVQVERLSTSSLFA